MPPYKPLEKYSLGVGDRFAHQGRAQLQAFVEARRRGIDVVPVWNKSNREHTLIGTEPESVLSEARDAVTALDWNAGFHVDADHIGLANVDRFIAASDFFTVDVADYTGQRADPEAIERFVKAHRRYIGEIAVPEMGCPLVIKESHLRAVAAKFLRAIQEAGRIYRHVAERKDPGEFVTEVSVDETDSPQTPVELFLILAMIAGERIPAQTIAPKFSGRFNKGVDYVGNLICFEREFEADLCIVAFAAREFGLPETLKLSVHSGSDKFSLYPLINRLLKRHGVGLHVKTAGTTWLEELSGLAESGGEGMEVIREIYRRAAGRYEELIQPYAAVVEIDRSKLPSPGEVLGWGSAQFISALRHDVTSFDFNPDFRQFLHVSFKVAAELGTDFTDAVVRHEIIIARNVTANLLRRHLLPIFG